MSKPRLIRVGGPILTMLLLAGGGFWALSCGPDERLRETPVGLDLVLEPIGCPQDGPENVQCNQLLTEPHPGPPPGMWTHNVHFMADSQQVISPSICTGYDFTENVHFKLEFSTGHDVVDFVYQYIDENGQLLGSRTPVEHLELGDGPSSATADFYIQLDDAPQHAYLLVWAVVDGDDEPCNFSLKLDRESESPSGSLDASLYGPQYPPENESCEWTSSVSGGSGSYSYQWLRNGQQVGTAPNLTLNTGVSTFELRLEVQSGGEMAWDTQTVNPNPQADDCPDLLPS